MRSGLKLTRFSNPLRWQFWLLVIVMGSFWGMLRCIHEGHNWAGDFALYIEQAKAISDGSLPELLETNRFSMQNSISEKGPYLYPIGFPVLLIPVVSWFGINLAVIKMFCGLFLVGSVLLTFFLFNKQYSRPYYPLLIAGLVALSAVFLKFCDEIRADLPYMFFSLVCFFLVEKRNSTFWRLMLGFCLFAAYSIRDVGVFLLLAVAVDSFIFRKDTSISKWSAITPFVVFVGLFAISFFALPQGNENHVSKLVQELSFTNAASNFCYYLSLLPKNLIGSPSTVAGSITLVLSVFGGIVSPRETRLYAVYSVAVFFMVVIWPSQQGVRFLLPILPFITYFSLQGSIYAVERLRIETIKFDLVLLLGFCLFADVNFKLVNKYSSFDTNQSCTKELMNVYEYVGGSLPKNAVVGFTKPRIFRLFSGVNSIYTDLGHFPSSVAGYLVVHRTEFEAARNEKLEVIHSFENYVLVAKR